MISNKKSRAIFILYEARSINIILLYSVYVLIGHKNNSEYINSGPDSKQKLFISLYSSVLLFCTFFYSISILLSVWGFFFDTVICLIVNLFILVTVNG